MLYYIYYKGNSYSLGRTDDRYPAIIAGLSCQGTEKTISSCNRAPNVDLQYCSLEVVETQCQGNTNNVEHANISIKHKTIMTKLLLSAVISYYLFLIQSLVVMVMSVFLMAITLAEYKYVLLEYGVQFAVTVTGIIMMPV